MGDPEHELKERAAARVGSVLREKWRLDHLLGIGGMAAVYAGTHRNGKLAAIKMLHPEAALIPDVKARFLREGYLANKVQHPGTVNILDDDVDTDGSVFLVMELLEGETLDARWSREKTLGWQQAFVIADKVLDVLVSAHKKDIVHRDLKPGNVFICVDGSVKILDFGIARLQTVTPTIRDTGGHISLGTPGFMPPEQARGQWARVDVQSDVWAVGATMFAMLTGRYVHEADTVNEQLLAAMTEPAPPIREILPDLPEEVAEVVDQALTYDKAKRWPDAYSMQQALRMTYELLVEEPISSAQKLTVPGVARFRSVLPDAPTVAASDLDSLRISTSRPVSARRGTTARRRARKKAWQRRLMIGGGGVVALVGAWMVLRTRDAQPEAPAILGSRREQPPAAVVAMPRASPSPTPPPEPARSVVASSVTLTPGKESSRRRTAKAEASAAGKPVASGGAAIQAARSAEPAPPSASAVDIFKRRK